MSDERGPGRTGSRDGELSDGGAVPTSSNHGTTTDIREDGAVVGMYHPKAAVRSSGGVAVFVQEAVRALAPERSVYLYSEGGEFTRTIQSSDVRVVTFERDRAWANLRELTPDVPFTPTWASNQLSESVVAFVNAARGSTLRHVEQQVDVLYTHNLVDTALLSNAVDVPVVRLFHSCQHVSRPGTVIDALSRPAARVANSDQTAREVATKLGHEVDWTVYPGVDLETFSPDSDPVSGEESPFDREGVAILFVGRFVESKGVYDLLEAFAEMDADTHLALVGRGDDSRVRREARERGVAADVSVVGEVPHHELPSYYAAADIACLPTRYESFGMVNVEAMACGTAVVTTDLPGVRRYATDGEHCLLARPGDPENLREKLSALVDSPDRRAALARAGRQAAVEFSWEATAAKLARVADVVSDSH